MPPAMHSSQLGPLHATTTGHDRGFITESTAPPTRENVSLYGCRIWTIAPTFNSHSDQFMTLPFKSRTLPVALGLFLLSSQFLSAQTAVDSAPVVTPAKPKTDLDVIAGWVQFRAAPDSFYYYLNSEALALLCQLAESSNRRGQVRQGTVQIKSCHRCLGRNDGLACC